MEKIFDIVGIGFGPSNLALAAAIADAKQSNLSALFFEKEPGFTWHKQMLLDETEMQISFLKDIATLRNPQSPFTFLNYLHAKGRLTGFINLKYFHPSRIEYNDYLSWVAEQLNQYVIYNRQVVDILPYGDKPHCIFSVVIHNMESNTTETILAKNLVIAPGGVPVIPDRVEKNPDSNRIWHNSNYLNKINNYKLQSLQPYHFAVIGRGQSAAEVAYDLHKNFPNSIVSCIHRNFGYKPADESQFSNEIFNAEAVDLFYSSTGKLRQTLLKNYADTNYSVVDIELIKKLYKISYEESITKDKRLYFLPFSSLVSMSEHNQGVDIEYFNEVNNAQNQMHVDAAILATGYEFRNPADVFPSLSSYLLYDEEGKPQISRHYRLCTNDQVLGGIYTQGCNEHSHGLTDTLLSIGAIRAREILQHIDQSVSLIPIQVTNEKEAIYA